MDEIEVEDEDIVEEDYEGEAEFNPGSKYSSFELEAFADKILKEDSNRELCRKCKEKDKGDNPLPYGTETGMVESVPQFQADGTPIEDDEGNQLYLDYPELRCEKGHRWFQGEGQRRDIRGKNPILFEPHLYNRKRREIYVSAGVPDPAFTMDRFGRPTVGMYNRAHPEGRKMNSVEQRQKNGAATELITPILTTNGWKTVGTLQIGDSIYGQGEVPTPIVGFSPVYKDHDCFRVIFEDNDSIVADGDHLWTLHNDQIITTKEMFLDSTRTFKLPNAKCFDRFVSPNPSIVKIEYVPPVPVRCLMVGNDDHLFLAGRGLHLTHNSWYR